MRNLDSQTSVSEASSVNPFKNFFGLFYLKKLIFKLKPDLIFYFLRNL